MNNKPFSIIAVSPNSWGRGNTVNAALHQLVKSGGKRNLVQLRFILGDDKPYINMMGDLMIAEGAESFKISEK